MPGCARFGVQVIHQHRTVTREPAACRGLSQEQVEQAVGQAIRLAEGGHHKAVLRGLAVAAGARLAYLITAAPPAPGPASRAPASVASSRPAAAGSAARRDLTVAVAALVSWLITAGSSSPAGQLDIAQQRDGRGPAAPAFRRWWSSAISGWPPPAC